MKHLFGIGYGKGGSCTEMAASKADTGREGGGMKFSAAVISLLLVAAVASHATGGETETMRCTGGLISIGDTATDVLAKCGEPAYRTQGVATRVLPRTPYSDRTIVSVTADQWLFNFGPNEFQYQVLLDGGRVFRIDSLDNHGY